MSVRERQKMERTEFENSLRDPLGWMKKDKEDVAQLLGTETAAMVDYDQRNPHHCYTLFEHALRTVEGLPKDCPALLRTAAFFHDIGKPLSAKEKNGRLVFYGHAAKSAEIAEPILKYLGYTADEVSRILFFISRHDDFIAWSLPEEDVKWAGSILVSKRNVKEYAEKAIWENSTVFSCVPELTIWESLLDLCLADIGAQSGSVYADGVLIDSAEHKAKKIYRIAACFRELYA